MIITRFTKSSSCSLCVTNTIVCRVESLESACITIVSVAESIALVGSSSSITDGLAMTARARATAWR